MIINAKCNGCGIINPMKEWQYLKSVNSSEIHLYFCEKCSPLKQQLIAQYKQERNLLTRKDKYYWSYEENRKKEFLNYISQNDNFDKMVKKDYGLYRAILEYENGNYEYCKKIGIDTHKYFKPKITKEYIVNCIKDFINENNRFPNQKELNANGISSKSFNKFFKNYSECKKYINYYNIDDLIDNRGDVNRSYFELYTANYLIAQGLGDKYLREEYPFKDYSYRSDFTFYLNNDKEIHVEVWADMEDNKKGKGIFENYLNVRKEKENLYKINSDKIILISINPNIFKGSLKSIERELHKIFKPYLNLKFEIIDYNLLTTYSTMSEEKILETLIKYSSDKNRLPLYKEIIEYKGGYGLIYNIRKRFGGLQYFADKYNINKNIKTKYWNKEKVFKMFDYMINKYNKFISRNEYEKSKELYIFFKGLFSYMQKSEGYIQYKLYYIDYLINNNIKLNNYIYNYLKDISNDSLLYVKSITLEQQQLAKHILDKYNNSINTNIN